MTSHAMRGKRIMTYGRFDQFDLSQAAFLREAARLGGELIVGCQSDALAAKLGHPCAQDFETRRVVLEKCRFVSRVVPETSPQQKRTDIVNYNISLLVVPQQARDSVSHLQDIAQIICLPAHTHPVAQDAWSPILSASMA